MIDYGPIITAKLKFLILTPCRDLLSIIKEDVQSESSCWILPNATVIQ